MNSHISKYIKLIRNTAGCRCTPGTGALIGAIFINIFLAGCFESVDVSEYGMGRNTDNVAEESDDTNVPSDTLDSAWDDSDSPIPSSTDSLSTDDSDETATDTEEQPFINRCLALDGDGDYVRVRHDDDLFTVAGEWTMEAWVWYVDDDSGLHPILRGADESTSISAYFMYAEYDEMNGGDKPLAGFGFTATGYEELYSRKRLPTEKWVHMAYVHGDVRHELYINGKLIDQKKSAADARPIADDVIIGAILHPRKTGYLNGYIDEVRISRVVRYADEFKPQEHFELDDDTLALWNFDKDFGDDHTMDASGTYWSELVGDAHIVDRDSVQ